MHKFEASARSSHSAPSLISDIEACQNLRLGENPARRLCLFAETAVSGTFGIVTALNSCKPEIFRRFSEASDEYDCAG